MDVEKSLGLICPETQFCQTPGGGGGPPGKHTYEITGFDSLPSNRDVILEEEAVPYDQKISWFESTLGHSKSKR